MHDLVYPHQLDQDALSSVVRRLKPLYQWYSPTADEERILTRIMAHQDTEIDLFELNGVVVAFGICVLIPLPSGEKCVFRHGTVIDGQFRSQGLYHQLFEHARERHHPDWYSTRTQNPRVYETWWKKFGGNLFPAPFTTLTQELKSLAVHIVQGKDSFEPDTFIARDVYREDRSGAEYHQCREAWIQEFFQLHLGVYDAFLLLGRAY